MKKRYFSVEQVLTDPRFDFGGQHHQVERSNRVTHSTRLEDMIYQDFYQEDTKMQEAEKLLSTRLTAQRDHLLQRLAEQVQNDPAKHADEVCRIAEQAASKVQQVQAVAMRVHAAQAAGRTRFAEIVHQAAERAQEQAELTKLSAIGWGTAAGEGKKQAVNRQRMTQLKENTQLLETMRQLGRLQEMVSVMRKNSFHYGRGVKYTVTAGRDLAHILSGEFALLAAPETVPLFVRRYQSGQLKQYARREPARKGNGDIIVCLDESSSTCGENAAWGKAIALALLDLCAHDGRRFALIHFSSASQVKTDIFVPGGYSESDFWNAAAHFFGGGTDFEAPLREVQRVIAEEGFENADVMFVTDGCCNISESFMREYRDFMDENHITMQGILLDIGPADTACLGSLCHQVLSTTALQKDDIFVRLAAG